MIDQNQSELTDKAELELDKLEENLYQRLDNIVEEMENKFTITEEKAKRLFKLLAEEQLQITSTSASGEKKEVFLSLGDRMIEFQEIIDRHAKALDRLWREWQAIQVEIVGLYAGEFGPDAVLAVEADLSPALKGAIEAGIDSWKQTSAERQAMKDEVLALQKLIQDNASSTIKTAKEQEKVRTRRTRVYACVDPWLQIWSTAFQRKLHNIMDNLKMIS